MQLWIEEFLEQLPYEFTEIYMRQLLEEIDRQVYDLYGLTPDEIELIEQTYRDNGIDFYGDQIKAMREASNERQYDENP